MSFIEGIGDDLLYTFGFLLFIGIISLAWLSTYVSHIHFPTTVFIIERRIQRENEEESERAIPVPSLNLNSLNDQPPANEILTEHESDIESSEIDEILSEPIPQTLNLNQSISPTPSIEGEDQILRITIKFLNETQKLILANANDTIAKIKRLYFADELSNNKIIRFIYQGRELQDSETLQTYNIRDQTIIHCQITTRSHSTPNRLNDQISTTQFNSNGFDTSPIHISSHLTLFFTLLLGSMWYLRIKYRVLFTPISTIILILITILFLIFSCGPLLTTRRQIQHLHLD